LYQYDNLNQLINFQRGTLNSTKNGISGTASRSQSWTPDALGNFTNVTTNGTAQTRTANEQNEYTSISGSGTITYDGNGNLTADGSGNTYVYDAWNRLMAVKNGSTTLASYSYDGLGRRIAESHGSTTTDLYLSAADQVLEERVAGVVQARNVWSPVYVNALVVRDQSSQHNGVLDQRLYVQQDVNWNVTALLDTSGNVLERYQYDPYGVVTVLSPSWAVQSNSNYNVPYGFQGMRYDWTVGVNFADNRVYSPTLMRWLQTDPIGLNAGTNDYAFVGNNPVNEADPTGLTPTKEQQQAWQELVNKYMGDMNKLAVPRAIFGIDRVKRDRLNKLREHLAGDLQALWRGAYMEWTRQENMIRQTYKWLENWHHSNQGQRI
jgi:RHS repeat-associated protein